MGLEVHRAHPGRALRLRDRPSGGNPRRHRAGGGGANPAPLALALDQPEPPDALTHAEAAVEEAASVTGRVERALELFTAVAQGQRRPAGRAERGRRPDRSARAGGSRRPLRGRHPSLPRAGGAPGPPHAVGGTRAGAEAGTQSGAGAGRPRQRGVGAPRARHAFHRSRGRCSREPPPRERPCAYASRPATRREPR